MARPWRGIHPLERAWDELWVSLKPHQRLLLEVFLTGEQVFDLLGARSGPDAEAYPLSQPARVMWDKRSGPVISLYLVIMLVCLSAASSPQI